MSISPKHASGRRLGRRSVLIGGTALLSAAAFAGCQVWSITDGLSNLRRTEELPTGNGSNTTSPEDPDQGRPVDILLLGSDSRDADAGEGRSDTLMLLHLDAAREHAYLISFPRDMWVEVPGRGESKINSAYTYGGTKLTARTINELVGIEIDHAAVIDFSGFADLTESVGGVTVKNTQAFSSHGFDYPKGKITISGKEALWFVRERHALPEGDFDRAANQRKVVKALVAKVADPATLANPTRLSQLIGNLSTYVSVDSGLTNAEILGLASSMKSAAESLVTLQAPVSGTGMIGGQSVDIVDDAKMEKLAKALQDDTMDRYAAGEKD